MNEEFKLNYYFNLYKDQAFVSNTEFKFKFIKKHGNFKYLNELAIMINKYQVRKYKQNLAIDNNIYGLKNRKNIRNSEKQSFYHKFGTLEERNNRRYENK